MGGFRDHDQYRGQESAQCMLNVEKNLLLDGLFGLSAGLCRVGHHPCLAT